MNLSNLTRRISQLSPLQYLIAICIFCVLVGVALMWGGHSRSAVTTDNKTPTVASTDDSPAAQTTTPQPEPTPTPTPTPAPTPAPSPAPTPAPKPAPTPTPAPTPPPASANCTNPVFTTSSTNGGWSNGGYYVHNNMWNSQYGFGPETLYACSYHNWYVTSSQVNHAGAVLTYPNVHKDYSGRTISSFSTLTSTFAGNSPSVGIYNVAYDIWLNGVPNDEVMIWTDNYNQVPAGNKFASNVNFSGRAWDVYATGGNGYIAFVPSGGARLNSGTIDIKAMLDYLVAQGRTTAGSTVDQIGWGVEIVSTNGSPATWNFTDFSITNN